MAPDSANLGDLAAILILADSSTSLFFQWNFVFPHYVGALFKRIGETCPGYTFRLGLITYGTSDTLPSPILCKKFFSESGLVVKAMKDEFQQLGLGVTSAGGSRGMATLEGLVAAIEMFDTLFNSYTPKNPSRPPAYHIIHLTSSCPDSVQHPQCNENPALDDTTWETIPSELANRKIHISSLVLNPKNKKVAELHSSPLLSKSPSSWFTMRPPHTAYLATFNIPLKGGVKRPGESAVTERSPDAKRLRTQPPIASPRIAAAMTPSTSTQSPKPGPSAPPFQMPQGPAPGVSNMPINLPPGMPPFQSLSSAQELFARLRAGEEVIKRLEATLAQANQAGDTSRAEFVRAELAKRRPSQDKAKVMMAQLAQTFRLRQTQGPGQGQNQLQAQGQGGPPAMGLGASNGPKSTTGQSQSMEATGSAPASNPDQGNMSAPVKSDTSPLVAHANVNPTIPPSQPSASTPFPAPGPPVPVAAEGSGRANSINTSHPNHGQPPQSDLQSQMRNVPNSSVGLGSPPNVVPQPGMHGLPQRMQMSPDVAAQMHKLIEQSERSGRTQGQMGTGPPPTGLQNPSQNQSPALSSVGIPNNHLNTNSNPGSGGPQVSNSMELSAVMPPGMVMGPQGMNVVTQAGQQPGPSTTPAGKPQSVAVWNGTLLLRGDPNMGKADLKIFVAAHSANLSESRPETWPQQMVLNQTRDPVVSFNDFQLWAKRHRPVVCTFRPHGVSPDQRMNLINENSFTTLVGLVHQSKTYVASGWTLPSGQQTNNALIAAIPSHGLIGAIFPLSGIPEMPKPTLAGALMQHGINMPAQVLSRIQSLPPDLQSKAVKAWVTQTRMARGGASNGEASPGMIANTMAVGGSMGGGMGNIAGGNGVGNGMQQNHAQGPQQSSGMSLMPGGIRPGLPLQQQPPDLMSAQFGAQGNMAGLLGSLGQGMHRPMNMNMTQGQGQNMMTASLPRSAVGGGPSGGGPPGMASNLSMEMLQSFMQRNAEGQGPS